MEKMLEQETFKTFECMTNDKNFLGHPAQYIISFILLYPAGRV